MSSDSHPVEEIPEAEAKVHQLAQHFFDSKPEAIEPKGGGLSNAVFAVTLPQGEFIVRMSVLPERINSYLKEQWAIASAKEVGVPTPEVLEVGNDIVGLPYMISRKVEGSVASDSSDRHAVLRELGRLTRLIHTIPTQGYGGTFDWSKNQLSKNETWSEYLFAELRIEERLSFFKEHRLLPPPALERLRSILLDTRKITGKTSLAHGDVRLKNTLVDEGGKITALLDWEHCTSTVSPYWDLSIALHDLSIDEKHSFLEGFGLSEKEFLEFAPLIKALNILNYAPTAERLVQADAADELEFVRLRLSGALDLYSL